MTIDVKQTSMRVQRARSRLERRRSGASAARQSVVETRLIDFAEIGSTRKPVGLLVRPKLTSHRKNIKSSDIIIYVKQPSRGVQRTRCRLGRRRSGLSAACPSVSPRAW